MKKPITLEEAVEYYYPKFGDGWLDMSEDQFASFCHSQMSGGIGMTIRNEMGFWEKKSKIYKHMVEVHHLEHPDDMSDLIIRHVHKKMKEDAQIIG
jgi:hypothetical protein